MHESSTLVVLGLGFLLGLKHATDPDHIVAVTTFLGKERQFRRACSIGLYWGLGHTIALSIAGLVVLGLQIPISRWVAERLELIVAAMLIILGARLIARVHTRWHEHHHHVAFTDWRHFGLRPLLVGIVHGTAGSAALTLLVLSTISSTVNGLLYILIFGIGSMLGMLVISSLLSLPIQLAGDRITSAIRPIQMGTGVLSCAFGLQLAASVWLKL